MGRGLSRRRCLELGAVVLLVQLAITFVVFKYVQRQTRLGDDESADSRLLLSLEYKSKDGRGPGPDANGININAALVRTDNGEEKKKQQQQEQLPVPQQQQQQLVQPLPPVQHNSLNFSMYEGAYDKYRLFKTKTFVAKGSKWDELSAERQVRRLRHKITEDCLKNWVNCRT